MTMNLAARNNHRARALVGGALAAALGAVLAGCTVSVGSGVEGSEPPSADAQGITTGEELVLRFDDRVATARLTDSPASRQFAAMLPVTLQLKDVWGQAKSGPLPGMLTTEGTVAIHDPVAGHIYFWPQTDVIAIYYDDLGQTVPDPGLVRLGVIESGLNSLAQTGRWVTVRIERADVGASGGA